MEKRKCKGISRIITFLLAMMLVLSNPVSVEAKAANTYAKYISQNGVYYSRMPKKYRSGYKTARKEYKANKSTGYGKSITDVMGKILFLADHTAAFNNSSKALSVKQSKRTYNIAKKWAKKANGKGTKYEKALVLHDVLMANVRYGNGQYAGQTAYEALAQRQAVCAGIARAYKLMCDIVGIKCYCVYGNAGGGLGESGPHQWNVIQLDDGQWYEVDVTFDLGLSSHDFFCLSTAEMANRTLESGAYFHQRMGLDEATEVFMSITPVANGTKYRYTGN